MSQRVEGFKVTYSICYGRYMEEHTCATKPPHTNGNLVRKTGNIDIYIYINRERRLSYVAQRVEGVLRVFGGGAHLFQCDRVIGVWC